MASHGCVNRAAFCQSAPSIYCSSIPRVRLHEMKAEFLMNGWIFRRGSFSEGVSTVLKSGFNDLWKADTADLMKTMAVLLEDETPCPGLGWGYSSLLSPILPFLKPSYFWQVSIDNLLHARHWSTLRAITARRRQNRHPWEACILMGCSKIDHVPNTWLLSATSLEHTKQRFSDPMGKALCLIYVKIRAVLFSYSH